MKKQIILLFASLLGGCHSHESPDDILRDPWAEARATRLQHQYHAKLTGPDLGCCITVDANGFPKDKVWSVAARFQRLERETADANWTVTVVMRTGSAAADNPNDARLQLSLRRTGDVAHLRVQEGLTDLMTGAISDTNTNITDTQFYKDIYDNSEPFILKIWPSQAAAKRIQKRGCTRPICDLNSPRREGPT
jgi:hypothetical protein